ncbi:hypothetical protein D3C77_747670 [compost metagenome]
MGSRIHDSEFTRAGERLRGGAKRSDEGDDDLLMSASLGGQGAIVHLEFFI